MDYEAMLDILRCPACASQSSQPDPGQLDLVSGCWLVCRDCDRKYPIRDGIPVMLIAEGDAHRHTPIEALLAQDTDDEGQG